jgi:hypothetical protein
LFDKFLIDLLGFTRLESDGTWTPTNELWALNVTTMLWTNLTTTGPSPRGFSSFFAADESLFLVSGCVVVPDESFLFSCAVDPQNEVGGANDMWVFDLGSGTWSQLHVQGQLPPGMSSITPIDGDSHDVLAYFINGDQEQSQIGRFNITTLTWTAVEPQSLSPPPIGRAGTSLVPSDVPDVFYLYGGLHLLSLLKLISFRFYWNVLH